LKFFFDILLAGNESNADGAYFVYPTNPWFNRGETYAAGTEAGVFAFGRGNGSANSNDSFRVVLADYFSKAV